MGQDGNRMDQPQFCPNEIYLLMRDCWKTLPNERPTFSDIVLGLAKVIESHCTDPEMLHHYLEPNHITGGEMSQCLKPIEGSPLGSYKFSPPPTYSQSFEDRRLATNESSPTTNRQQRQPSEIPSFGRQMSDRYVPEKKRVVYVEEGCDQLEEPTEERVDGTAEIDSLRNGGSVRGLLREFLREISFS